MLHLRMSYERAVILGGWAVFVVYWIVSSRRVKKTAQRDPPWTRVLGGGAILLLVMLAQRSALAPFLLAPTLPGSPALRAIAVALGLSGMAFAMVARWHLGRNWSGEPSLKEGHELVTSGPYRIVRHPIYTGVIAAVLGSALATDRMWLFILPVTLAVALYRIPREERLLAQQFPEAHPAYRARTKALIPGLW